MPSPFRLGVFGLALMLTSCAATASPPVSLPPILSSTSISLPPVSPVLPDALLAARLDEFLAVTLSGGNASSMFAGDRLLILTADTFSELPRSYGPLLLDYSFSLGFGCGKVCSITFQDFLQILRTDWRTEPSAVLGVPVTSSLAAWPSLGFSVGDRGWRISFDATGAALVAIEYFGPTPL